MKKLILQNAEMWCNIRIAYKVKYAKYKVRIARHKQNCETKSKMWNGTWYLNNLSWHSLASRCHYIDVNNKLNGSYNNIRINSIKIKTLKRKVGIVRIVTFLIINFMVETKNWKVRCKFRIQRKGLNFEFTSYNSKLRIYIWFSQNCETISKLCAVILETSFHTL